MEIAAVEVYNLNSTGMWVGNAVPYGCLGITVTNYSFGDYKIVDVKDIDLEHWALCDLSDYEKSRIKSGAIKAIFATSGDLVSVFGWARGTTDGFANRKITLRIEQPSCMFPAIKAVKTVIFKGDLWDSHVADRLVMAYLDTPLRSIGIRKTSERNSCYCSAKATQALYDKLAKVIILGQPLQGGINETII